MLKLSGDSWDESMLCGVWRDRADGESELGVDVRIG